jgi:hypothetical protein
MSPPCGFPISPSCPDRPSCRGAFQNDSAEVVQLNGRRRPSVPVTGTGDPLWFDSLSRRRTGRHADGSWTPPRSATSRPAAAQIMPPPCPGMGQERDRPGGAQGRSHRGGQPQAPEQVGSRQDQHPPSEHPTREPRDQRRDQQGHGRRANGPATPGATRHGLPVRRAAQRRSRPVRCRRWPGTRSRTVRWARAPAGRRRSTAPSGGGRERSPGSRRARRRVSSRTAMAKRPPWCHRNDRVLQRRCHLRGGGGR